MRRPDITHKYICYDCGKGFDHPKMVKELRDSISLCGCTHCFYETMSYCPHCDSEVFDLTENFSEDDYYVWHGINRYPLMIT